MDILILCLIVLMGWAAWIAFRPSSRRRTINANLHQHDGSLQKRDTLRDEPAELITIPEPNNRLLSADDERHALQDWPTNLDPLQRHIRHGHGASGRDLPST